MAIRKFGDVRLLVGLGIFAEALWLAYLHDGGSVSCAQLERFVHGDIELDAGERAILVAVMARPFSPRGSVFGRLWAEKHALA